MSRAGELPEDFNDLRARDRKRSKPPGWFAKLMAAGVCVTIIIPVLWVALYGMIEAPGTLLMARRASQDVTVSHDAVRLKDMSPHLVRAVIAAEDSRFCAHNGFDREAIEKALDYNERQAKRGSKKRRGASTISQQTAKNLFLWPDRSWVRKGLEVYFTFLIEALWPKKRIMEAYLNAAEFGDGAFGVEAGAQKWFGKSAKDLSRGEAAKLAAILPSPNRWKINGAYVGRRTGVIVTRMGAIRNDGLDACVFGGKAPPAPREGAKAPPKPAPLPPLPAPPPELAPPEESAPLDIPQVIDGQPLGDEAPADGAPLPGAAPVPEAPPPAPQEDVGQPG